jgi:hypothetical protein
MLLQMNFSVWKWWPRRVELGEELLYPGVYAIRLCGDDLNDLPFDWSPQIIYIGMSNAIGGIKSRLNQFDQTMRTAQVSHGGADRVRYKHRDYSQFSENAYVSVYTIPCNVTSNRPADLRTMGEVCRAEYEALAMYAENYCRLPEFNDKRTNKFSKSK